MSTEIRTHKDLNVYQTAMDYVAEIYNMTKFFPADEKFGLTNQLRRAAISIPSNIAEGAARKSTKEFIHFLYIASASLTEVETQIEIAVRLGYLENGDSLLSTNFKIKRMLLKLIEALKRQT